MLTNNGDLTKNRMIDKFSAKNGKPIQYCSHDMQEEQAPAVKTLAVSTVEFTI